MFGSRIIGFYIFDLLVFGSGIVAMTDINTIRTGDVCDSDETDFSQNADSAENQNTVTEEKSTASCKVRKDEQRLK